MVALLAITLACATKTASQDGAPVARRTRNANVISREELQDPAVAANDAMTTIRQLRPAYFMTRGPLSIKNATAGLLQISQDFGPLQKSNALSAIDTRSLVEVRYLNATEATARFGINANGGPVLVLLTSTQ
ncbi:MAG TPA: hypothetical protein VF461_08080 [Gemmatimonadaceae bacterium]